MGDDKKSVLVTGDFVLDYHIYEGRRKHYGDGVSPGVRIVAKPGGAWLVHDLLTELLTQTSSQKWESRLAVESPPPSPAGLSLDTSQNAYAFWRPFPRDAAEDKQYWRVSEAMGFGAVQTKLPCESWPPAKELPDNPKIIVLSDGGMGFRDAPACWKNLKFEEADSIVLKTSAPLFEGALWKTLSQEKYSDKLVVVVSARELRKSAARISSGLSWEETIGNLIRDLEGKFAPLRRCRHLVVAFESEGGVWIDFTKTCEHSKGEVHFVYDPLSAEGDHARGIKGDAFGFLSCLTAAVAWQLTLDGEPPNLAAALEGGLSAKRDLRKQGHGTASSEPLGFPAERLARVIATPTYCYSIATFSCVKDGGPTNADWSILSESRVPLESKSQANPLSDLARLVVLNGPIALANFPQLKIGKLLTVDRGEIESLRTISQIIRNYEKHDSGKKPLSIGVFGPPGSGKSFAVEEVAKSLGAKEAWREFNLSQFNDPNDLIGAFHQIRDLVLRKLLPVAFFDEFDSQKYRWLQYLLAPMQDGKFQEGQLTHPLGKCILIFAGGTSWTFETFGPPKPEGSQTGDDKYGEFLLAKGPDFRSRLDGYLNVSGPNRRIVSTPHSMPDDIQYDSRHPVVEDCQDDHFRIRRALMIRSVLKCEPDQKLKIDPGVLHALLNVPKYKNGSRSLEKILQPLATAIPDPIHRSSLLPHGQLEMHTNADQFIELLDQGAEQPDTKSMPEEDINAMAPAIHETWTQLGLKVGWLKPTEKKEFADLDDFDQNSNRAGAERMPKILALVGLKIEQGAYDDLESVQAVRQHLEYHLELLAEAEHDGWTQWHREQGWHYAPKMDKTKKLRPCLIAYRELSDEDKNKDRTQIRSYPDIAERAGKKIVFN